MKAIKSKIPEQSLVNNYFPADYTDAFYCECDSDLQLTPDDIMVRFWTDFPWWVETLFAIRNFFVRLIGLQAGRGKKQEIEQLIRNEERSKLGSIPVKNGQETVLLLDDSHLDAYTSVLIENKPDCKVVYTITLVHYKKRLGSIYFFFVRPFHGIIVKKSLKRTLKKYSK